MYACTVRPHLTYPIYPCMYISMYVHIHVCTYMSMYVYVHVCTYPCMYIYMYVRTCPCMYMSMYVHIHVCTYTCTYMYMHVCTCPCLYMSIYVHVHVCTCMSMYVHVHVCSDASLVCTPHVPPVPPPSTVQWYLSIPDTLGPGRTALIIKKSSFQGLKVYHGCFGSSDMCPHKRVSAVQGG